MIKLIVFLGNVGKEYKKTRHNAGFMMAEEMFKNERFQIKFHSEFLKYNDLIVLKPLTFMNLSGTAVSEACSFFKIKVDEVLVVHDDLELALGKAKLQQGGGLAGHNGLRNIKQRLGSDNFFRLRLGIGKPKHKDVKLFVTSDFLPDEMILFHQIVKICEANIDFSCLKEEAFSVI